jgi:hypothetical protein
MEPDDYNLSIDVGGGEAARLDVGLSGQPGLQLRAYQASGFGLEADHLICTFGLRMVISHIGFLLVGVLVVSTH